MKRLGNNIKVKDDLDVFGENVACHLRKMKDERNRVVAKHRINQVLFEMELAEYSNSSSSAPSTSFNTTSRPSSAGSPSLLRQDSVDEPFSVTNSLAVVDGGKAWGENNYNSGFFQDDVNDFTRLG